MMVMYALQINVLVFRKYVEDEQQEGQPPPPPDEHTTDDGDVASALDDTGDSPSRSTTSSRAYAQSTSALSSASAPNSPPTHPLYKRHMSQAAQSVPSQSLLESLATSPLYASSWSSLPLARRATASWIRPSLECTTLLQRTTILEHVPELRARSVYHSTCENLAAAAQDSTYLVTIHALHCVSFRTMAMH
jgi:hypothetical protein